MDTETIESTRAISSRYQALMESPLFLADLFQSVIADAGCRQILCDDPESFGSTFLELAKLKAYRRAVRMANAQ